MQTTPTTQSSLHQKILDGKVKIQDMKLEYKEDFEAALNAISTRPSLATTLNPQNPDEKKLLIEWLKKPKLNESAPNKIAYVNPEFYLCDNCYDNDIILTHLNSILSKKNRPAQSEIEIFQSLRGDLVLKVNFETKKGEEIVYRDKELDMPIYLLANLDLMVKITNPYAFVKFIDINIQQINFSLLTLKLMPIISSALRSCVLATIAERDICYYELTKYYTEISARLESDLQKTLANAGVEVYNTYIKNTSIPSEADKIYEKQRIEFMQKEKNINLNHKAEALALENYEKKAEIHNKYPNYEIGLTEKEKDNAIDRYIIKLNRRRDENYDTAVNFEQEERSSKIGVVDAIKPTVEFKQPKPAPKKPNIIPLIVIAALGLIGTIIAFAAGAAPALAILFLAIGIATGGSAVALAIDYKSKYDAYLRDASMANAHAAHATHSSQAASTQNQEASHE